MNIGKGNGAIAKGALVGGTFASLSTPGANHNDSRAEVTLLFADGETLSVSVSKNEFQDLQSKVMSNSLKELKPSTDIPSIIRRSHNFQKATDIIEKRRCHSFNNIILLLLINIFMASSLFSVRDVVFGSESVLAIPINAVLAISGILMPLLLLVSFFRYQNPMTKEEQAYFDKLSK